MTKPLKEMLSHTYKCKECKNKARRTGNSIGRPKGIVAWNKGIGTSKTSWRVKEWCTIIKNRDKWICQHCGCEEKNKLHAHHIVPWNDNVDLRFEISNGITLCRSCHKKEDRRLHPEINKLRGIPRSKETKEKLRLANLGKSPPNKGKKGLQVAWNKGIKTGHVPVNKGKKWILDKDTNKHHWM